MQRKEARIVNNFPNYSIQAIPSGTRQLPKTMRIALWLFVWMPSCLSSTSYAQAVTLSPVLNLETTSQEWGIEPLFHLDLGLRGAASCAASSCHGGPRPGVSTPSAARGSEYSLWLEKDPHAQSWRTLSSEASQRILTKLGIVKQGTLVNQPAYENCLACHNTSRDLSEGRLTPPLAEGVGCELCHGPAQPWYDRHYQASASRTAGMTDIGPLVQRAKLCTTCHVGSSDRDMNHDIIAAGHPALYFDMAVYHDRYPKHWRESGESHSDFRARLWLAGQIAMIDAELDLLESRLKKSLTVSTWPELSLYRCTDCHVALNGLPQLPRDADRELVATGRSSPREWNWSGIDSLTKYLSRDAVIPMTEELQKIKLLLQDKPPDASKVLPIAQSLRRLLATQFNLPADRNLQNWDHFKLRNWSREQLSNPKVAVEWEAAAKFYIATWSSSSQFQSKEMFEAMRTMRYALVFPQDKQSPRFPRQADSLSPPNLEEWRSALRQAAVGLLESNSP